jgi:sorbose reductase
LNEQHEQALHDIITTDLTSVCYSAYAVGKHFRAQRAGSFIATASISGHIVNIPQMQSAYNAAKAAVIHFCKSLAVEWALFARVNTVSPGYFDTNITAGFTFQDMKNTWISLIPMR